MNIQLDRESPVPLARQIEEQIERLIRERLLAPGVKLPATRELAGTLGVNRATVALAYEELVAAGRARAHVGQGTFVRGAPGRRPPGAVVGPPPSHRLVRALSRAARRSSGPTRSARRGVGTGQRDADVVSFAGGMPDSGLFPTDAFRRVLNGVIRDEGSPPAVLPGRAATRRCGGISRRTCFASASRRAPRRSSSSTARSRASISSRGPHRSGGRDRHRAADLSAGHAGLPLVRGPAPARCRGTARGRGPRCSSACCERHAPKLFYCQPSAHNPTGLAMTPETGGGCWRRAARHQVPIVEDGFDGSLYYGARRPARSGRGPRRRGDLHRHVLEDPVPGSAARLDRRAAGHRRAAAGGQAARRSPHERADPGRGAPLLRGTAARSPRRAGGPGVRPAPDRLLAALARRMPEGVTWTEPCGGFSLLLTLPSGSTRARSSRGHRARGGLHARRGLLRRRKRGAQRCACRSRRCRGTASTRACAGSPRRSRPGGAADARGRRPSGSRRWWCDPESSALAPRRAKGE